MNITEQDYMQVIQGYAAQQRITAFKMLEFEATIRTLRELKEGLEKELDAAKKDFVGYDKQISELIACYNHARELMTPRQITRLNIWIDENTQSGKN